MAEHDDEGVKVGGVSIGETKQVVAEAPEAIPEINALESPDGYGHVVACRDGYELKRLGGRDEGRRVHIFDDIETFAAYLKRHADGDETEILLGDDGVQAALDPKVIDPETIDCKLDPHPTFAAWSEAFGSPLSQREFHALARGFRDALEDEVGILQALRVMSVARKGEVTSEIDETGATRLNLVTDRVEMAATVPPEFVLKTPIYRGIVDEDGDTITYDIEILVTINVEQMQFVIEAPGLPLAQAQARQDAAMMLARELGDPFQVGLGTLVLAERKVFEEIDEAE